MTGNLDDETLELEFLRFFYNIACESMGPADDDIYNMIKLDFKDETGLPLPEGYYDPEEDD